MTTHDSSKCHDKIAFRSCIINKLCNSWSTSLPACIKIIHASSGYNKCTRRTCEMSNRSKETFCCTKMSDSVDTRNCRLWYSPLYGCITLSTISKRSQPLEEQAEIVVIVNWNPSILLLENLDESKCTFSHQIISRASRPEGYCHQVTSLEGGVKGNIRFYVPETHSKWGRIHDNWWKQTYLPRKEIRGLRPWLNRSAINERLSELLELL